MAPVDNSNTITTALVTISGGVIIYIGKLVHTYLLGRAEGKDDLHGRSIILEQAELANVTELTQYLKNFGPRLDKLIDEGSETNDIAIQNGKRMEEILRVLRGLEVEMEVVKRLRDRH